MSRVGSQIIIIPKEVTVEIKNGQVLVVGPRGNLRLAVPKLLTINIKAGQIRINRKGEDWPAKSLHGVIRTLIANMIEGVTKGYTKTLKVVGTGYRAKLNGEKLEVTVGFSHPVVISPPEGIKFQVQGNDKIIVEGNHKELVGQVAAKIRAVRPPEPYKGKGIRYWDEEVRKKAGKALKAGAAAGGGVAK